MEDGEESSLLDPTTYYEAGTFWIVFASGQSHGVLLTNKMRYFLCIAVGFEALKVPNGSIVQVCWFFLVVC